MPKTFSQEQQFPYPWQLSARAVWNKYPNPHADHVVSVDVIEQTLDPLSGRLRSERILGVRQGAPRWITRIFGGSEDTYVREVVMVDPFKKSFEMSSTNLSLSEYMLVKEWITYSPRSTRNASGVGSNSTQGVGHQSSLASSASATPSSDDVTIFNQTADISCTGLEGIFSSAARKIEEWSYNRFGDNAAKGRRGLMSVLQAMYGGDSE